MFDWHPEIFQMTMSSSMLKEHADGEDKSKNFVLPEG